MARTDIILRPPIPEDGERISAIQAEGLAGGHASFRETAVTWGAFSTGYPLAIVSELGGQVVGWSALSGVSDRCTYAGVGEVSTYVARAAAGRGVGAALLGEIVAQSEAAGWWTLVAQLFPENQASLALHERLGFRLVGTRRGLGKMGYGPMEGVWRDVLMMERRSEVAGT